MWVLAIMPCLFVCLLINYNDAFDRTNVMASINVRQRINVRIMGISRPSLAGQCPPIKKGLDPTPFPYRHPPKTTNKNLRDQEKFPISHPKIEKRPQESSKEQNPDRPLSNQPNKTMKPIKSMKNQSENFDQACHHWEPPRYTNPGLHSPNGPNSEP